MASMPHIDDLGEFGGIGLAADEDERALVQREEEAGERGRVGVRPQVSRGRRRFSASRKPFSMSVSPSVTSARREASRVTLSTAEFVIRQPGMPSMKVSNVDVKKDRMPARGSSGDSR